VALAAALSLPVTTDAGAQFPDRDLVILMTLTVIVMTLVVQGLTLRPVLRTLGLTDEDEAYREEALARERAAQAALATLEKAADRHGLPEDGRRWLEREYSFRSRRFGARAEDGGDAALEERSRRLAATDAELLDSAREAILELEASGEVRGDIAQAVLRDLDLDSARLDVVR
jgi:CPA1 family monovalent cation:H+ antiporter